MCSSAHLPPAVASDYSPREEDHVSATIIFVKYHNKMSTQGPVPKIGLDSVTYVKKIVS